jgi:hypothetical protein
MFKHTQHNVKQMAIVVACAAIMAVILLPAGAAAQRVLELNEMTILNEAGITLQGNFFLKRGSICSREGNIVLGGKGKTWVDQGNPYGNNDSSLDTGDTVVTESTGAELELKHFARFGPEETNQTAYTDNLNPSGTSGVRLPPVVHSASLATCPDDPPFPVFIYGTKDVVCERGGTDIFPGTYGDLSVAIDGVCNFRGPGDYIFRSIQTMNTSYELNFLNGECDASNGFNINVATFVTFGEYGSVNRSGADSVFIHVAGYDGPYTGVGNGNNNTKATLNPTKLPSVFEYRGDGHFNVCYVFTPNGTTALKGISKSTWNTQWINLYIEQTTSQTIYTGVMEDYEACCETPPDCACILDFWESGDTLYIIGKGFNTRSVKTVLFFEENETIDDLSDPGDSATCKQPIINIIDSENMEVVVPAGCPSGKYYVGLENGGFCYAKNKKLNIPIP